MHAFRRSNNIQVFLKLITLAIRKRYQIEIDLGKTMCLTESLGILVHNEFKLLSFSGTLSLEATNTPGTAKILGYNLTGIIFFSNKIFLLAKNCRLIICLLMLSRHNNGKLCKLSLYQV